MCTIHDAPEYSKINDITYDAKCAMPEISKILEKL
jgi:5'-deoxynucleotidase YfbR-like HD superfamily hydrolase